MFETIIPHVTILGISFLLCISLFFYSLRHREIAGARAFSLLMMGAAVWSLGYMLEILSEDLSWKLFWLNVQQLGIHSAPVAWFYLIASFTGYFSRLKTRGIVFLSLIPLITVALLWTNRFHGCMRTQIYLVEAGALEVVGTEPTGFLYAAFSYNLLLFITGFFSLIMHTFRSNMIYRKQGFILIHAMLFPLAVNLMELVGFNPVAPFGLTTTTFIPMSFLLFLGLFRYRLLDLWPVARESIISSMGDGLLITDHRGRIVDMNEPCTEMLGVDAQSIGSAAEVVLQDYPSWQALFQGEGGMTRIQVSGEGWYDVRVSGLFIENTPSGYVSLLRDVTTEEQTQAELISVYRRLNNELMGARRVHEQLLQPDMPSVEGLSLSAVCRPATYIGGDFYQLIRKGHKLIVYLSDVSGHGLDGTMFSHFVKSVIASYVELTCTEDLSVQSILQFLDGQVRQGSYPSQYSVAIFVMVVDVETWDITYSACGFQNPPILTDREGFREYLVSAGLPISRNVPREAMDFSEKHLSMPQEAVLFLASDGLYEQSKDEVMYEERFLPLLQEYTELPGIALLDLIEKDFEEFRGEEELTDDLTMIILSTFEIREFTVCSSLEALEEVREEVLTYYRDHGGCEAMVMAAHELAANAIEHGNKGREQASVRMHLSPRALVVEDEGEGFDWQGSMPGTGILHFQGERGRGISMVQLLGDLIYNDRGNRVTFILQRDVL